MGVLNWREDPVSLQTACPICHTVFKVDDIHLSSAQGMVQCGVCGMVFNASQHMQVIRPALPPETSSIDTTAPSEALPDATAGEEPDTIESNDFIGHEQAVSNDDLLSDDTTIDNIPDTSIEPLPADESEPEAIVPIYFKKRLSRKHKVAYSVAAVLLSSSLAIQLSIPYRYQIAAAYPAFTPLYDTICQGHLCSMTTPYDVSQIELTNSNFEIDPIHKNLIKVTLDIQNNADIQLQYPRFALTLTDNEDTIVSIRKIYPSNYLANIHKVLDPHEEQVIKIQISLVENNVSGYKLRLF